MKAKLVRPLQRKNPQYKPEVHADFERRGKHYPIPKYVEAPAGTVIEHKDAWQLVANGDAQPACLDCQARVDAYFQRRGQSYAEGMAEAIKQRDRLDAGIMPEHFQAYEEGRMDGYDDKGRPTLAGERVDLPEDQPADQLVIVINEGEVESRKAKQ
jgi:hypothetical protein